MAASAPKRPQSTDPQDPFSLFGEEEQMIAQVEEMARQLDGVSGGVKRLSDAYRQSYREQRRMVRISDRLQLDLQRANQTLQSQALELQTLNAALKSEMAEREKLTQELHRIATIDMLTEVYTRRRVIELGSEMWREALLPPRALSVLLIDLDHFKRVNDVHGHAAGDALLQAFGSLCRNTVGQRGAVGRLGGEEFLVLLPGANSEDALALAEALRQSAAGHQTQFEGTRLGMTVSIGVATRTEADASLQKLISRADLAVYQAKHLGRNRVAVA